MAELPCDPFGRPARPPRDLSRAGRVELLVEAFEAWAVGRQPSDEARLFAAGGGLSWLREGGDLVRDFWDVKGRQGCTVTAADLAARLREEGQDDPEPED